MLINNLFVFILNHINPKIFSLFLPFISTINTHLSNLSHSDIKHTMTSLEALLWKEVINSEVESIVQNHIWKLSDISYDIKPTGYK